jgi:hypothetical protein
MLSRVRNRACEFRNANAKRVMRRCTVVDGNDILVSKQIFGSCDEKAAASSVSRISRENKGLNY